MLARVDFDAVPTDGEYTRPSEEADIEYANLVTSLCDRQGSTFLDALDPMHKVVIDLDHPAQLIESSTPGHHHLIIDHEIPWSAYLRLLGAMVECGLVEPGYMRSSIDRGYTAVRLPWVKKNGHDKSSE
jgi:hypothetical protein